MKEGLLTRQEAADYLGLKKVTLESWACNMRYNLPYIKVGRMVRYRIEDLDAFMKERTQRPIW